MQYMVVGADGNEYGPATLDTLKAWVVENRLTAGTQLRDYQTGQLLVAGTLPEIFPLPPVAAEASPAALAVGGPSAPPSPVGGQWSQPPNPSNYTRTMQGGPIRQDNGMGDVWGAIIRSVVALVFFFLLNGIGVIFAGYALYYAIRAHGKGHKMAPVAIAISAVSLAAILIGWVLRLNGTL